MKVIPHILALAVLFAVYHTAGLIWGINAKIYFFFAMIALYVILAASLTLMRRRMRREQPDLVDAIDPKSGAPWYWNVIDAVFGVSLAFGPPIAVSVVRRQPLSLDGDGGPSLDGPLGSASLSFDSNVTSVAVL